MNKIRDEILDNIRNMRCQANECCDRDNCINQMVRLNDVKKRIINYFEECKKDELGGKDGKV